MRICGKKTYTNNMITIMLIKNHIIKIIKIILDTNNRIVINKGDMVIKIQIMATITNTIIVIHNLS